MTTKPIFGKPNVLVTGGAGFIGSHLCDELLQRSKVICLDDFSTGSLESIRHLLAHPDFKLIRHDISQPFDLEGFAELEPFQVRFQGIQQIFNLACPTSPQEYDKLPLPTLLANSLGVKNVLDLAVRYQCPILHTSTSAVYGSPALAQASWREDTFGAVDPTGPRSAYNEGKRFAEAMIINYRDAHNLNATVARIFPAYGPRMMMAAGRMIPDFAQAALDGRDLVIYGDAQYATSLIYIQDLVDGLVRLQESPLTGAYNLGSPLLVRMAEVAELVLELTGSTSKIVYADPLPYSVPQLPPDIGKIKEELGWFPIVDLRQGLQKTVDYMRASRGILMPEQFVR